VFLLVKNVKNILRTSKISYNRNPVNKPRKRPRSYPTRYRYKECTQEKVIDCWLCNTVKNVNGVETILDCHAKYHAERKLFGTTTSSENSVISDLTEE
jgi:hypothetical protein